MTTQGLPPMTPAELEALVRKAVRAELNAVGMRVDDQDDQDAIREDLRFTRRMRKAFESASGKVGGAIIISIVGGFIWLMTAGLNALWGKS